MVFSLRVLIDVVVREEYPTLTLLNTLDSE